MPTEEKITQENIAKPRRGRPKLRTEAESRALICTAAMSAFIEKGFARATMSDIATGAGMSKRDLYLLFPDKAALFAETIKSRRYLLMALPRPEGEDQPPLEVLPLIFRLDLEAREADERDALLNLIARESLLLPDLNTMLYDTGIIRSRELLMEWLADQMDKGALPRRPDLTEAGLAGLLMDVTHGVLLPRRQRQSAVDRNWQRREIQSRFAIVLRGINTDISKENKDV